MVIQPQMMCKIGLKEKLLDVFFETERSLFTLPNPAQSSVLKMPYNLPAYIPMLQGEVHEISLTFFLLSFASV
jgi:hypothetical protein